MAMLEVKDLYVSYGMIAALKGISFEVNEGEVIALIGANGAGKTTTLHTLTGLLHAKSGSITFDGKELTKTPAHKIVEMGIAHVPEGRRIFQNLTVIDNLKLGAFTRKDKAGIAKDIEEVYELFPRLAERKTQIAGTLSGGEQQKMAIARALYKDAPVVILDEPTAALDPVAEYEIYRQFNDLVHGKTAVYISHRLSSCKFCDRIAVFSDGTIKESGTHEELVHLHDGIYAEMFKAQAQYYV